MTAGLLPCLLVFGDLTLTKPADPTAISIEFDSPSGCSSADSFYEGITNRTSKVRRAQEGEVASLVRIRLFRAGAKIRGELRLSDQDGEKETRKVDGATCDEVVEALALTVTLALDPDAVFTRSTQGDGFSSNPTKLPPPTHPPPANPLTQTSPLSPPSHWELGARWTVATVIVPGFSLGPSLRGKFISEAPAVGPYSVGAFFSYLRNDLLATPKYGEFGLALAGVELCPIRSRSGAKAEVGLCALGIGGWLSSRGVALDHPESTHRSWWEAGLRSFGALRVDGGFYLGVDLSATVPLISRRFTVDGEPGAVAHSPSVAIQGAFGFDYMF